jgi:hypothetical protein
VTTETERLIAHRPQAFGSGVRSGEKRETFEDLLALVERGVREYQRGKVLKL